MDIQRNAQRLTLEQIMSTAHDLKLKVPESVDTAKARVGMLDPYIGRPASREDLINAQSPEEIERLVADMARHAALSNGPGAMAIQQAKTMLLDEYIRVMHEGLSWRSRRRTGRGLTRALRPRIGMCSMFCVMLSRLWSCLKSLW